MGLSESLEYFENNLAKTKESIVEMDHCVDDAILEPVKELVCAYEDFLKKHIEALINENCDLQFELEKSNKRMQKGSAMPTSDA